MRTKQTTLNDKDSVLRLLEKYKFIRGNCWRSLVGKTNDSGHPILKIEGKSYFIARLSLYVFRNFDLNSDLLALHKIECGYPDCWNPEHLYAGNASDNRSDNVRK